MTEYTLLFDNTYLDTIQDINLTSAIQQAKRKGKLLNFKVCIISNSQESPLPFII